MEGSCAKDWGKELGQIHEGIITLRNLGLTPAGWEKVKDDKELARRVVELIEGQKEFWLEKILAQERACHLAFFGQEFDLTKFADTLRKYGESKIRFWTKLLLEPHFLPEVVMSQDASFKGWKVKPESRYYEKAAGGKIFRNINGQLVVDKEPFKLEGITVLIDTRLKPRYNDGKQMYENDNLLGPIIEKLRKNGSITKYEYGSQSSRFGTSADNEWGERIKPAFAEFLSVSRVLLEPAIVANIIPQLYPYMPRKDDGNTDTWVWYEEYFEGRDRRLGGGYSGLGGLAHVHWHYSGGHWRSRSLRPLAVL